MVDATRGFLSLIQKLLERKSWKHVAILHHLTTQIMNSNIEKYLRFSFIKWEICKIDSSIEIYYRNLHSFYLRFSPNLRGFGRYSIA